MSGSRTIDLGYVTIMLGYVFPMHSFCIGWGKLSGLDSVVAMNQNVSLALRWVITGFICGFVN